MASPVHTPEGIEAFNDNILIEFDKWIDQKGYKNHYHLTYEAKRFISLCCNDPQQKCNNDHERGLRNRARESYTLIDG